jgi:CheY-like chemotaxis protein
VAYAPRILIVDDEATVRRFFAVVLSEDGYSVTGRQALLLIHNTEFELIVIDMSLPDTVGVELISQVRADFLLLKILVNCVKHADETSDSRKPTPRVLTTARSTSRAPAP